MAERTLDLPKRNRQHELDTASRRHFDNLLPDSWLFNPARIDTEYGIDGTVEVFQDERATGITFKIQLKATDAIDINGPVSISLEKSTLNYLSEISHDTPVLMLLYHACSKKMYAKWFHKFDPYYDKAGNKANRNSDAQTISFWWQAEDEWTNDTIEQIYKDLEFRKKIKTRSFSLPIKFNVEFSDTVIAGNQYWSLLLNLTEAAKPHKFITIGQYEPHTSLGNIHLSSGEIKVSFGDNKGFVLHIDPTFNIAEEVVIADTLIGIALCLYSFTLYEYGSMLINEHIKSSSFLNYENTIFLVTRKLIIARDTNGLLSITELLTERAEQQNQNVTHRSFLLNTALLVGFQAKMFVSTEELDFQRYLKALERVLKVLKSIDDPKQLGIAHYNLSNSLANADEKSRLKHLRMAGQLNSDYLTRSYYFEELGSTLFNLRRYRLSATSYQKALSIDKRGETIAFYADALLHCGEYDQSLREFQSYVRQCEDNQVEVNALWYLKFLVLKNLVSKTGIVTQRRETLKARKLSLSATTQPQEELRNTLEAALQLDLVCSDAWHNLGHSYGAGRDSDKALSCFSCSLLTHTQDMSSWMCVFLHAFNVDNIPYGMYAITGAHLVFGNRFLKEASNFIASQTDPSFPKNEMMNALLNVSKELLNNEKPLILRIVHEDGSYEVLNSQSI